MTTTGTSKGFAVREPAAPPRSCGGATLEIWNRSRLVSIIIPVYKVEKFLDECVASVAAQTYANLEILLVDDGSPDNCPAMCDAWAARDRAYA